MNVTVSEAKATLSALVARVEAGERIGITRRGVVVAVLDAPMMPMDAAMEVHYAKEPTPALLQPKPAPAVNGARGLTLAEILKAGR